MNTDHKMLLCAKFYCNLQYKFGVHLVKGNYPFQISCLKATFLFHFNEFLIVYLTNIISINNMSREAEHKRRMLYTLHIIHILQNIMFLAINVQK